MQRKDKRMWGLYFAAIFICMLVFYTIIHPFIISNTDDWTYISYARHAMPLWGNWNPTRVFPEVFLPLCGNLAAYVVYPLTGDYINALGFVFAVVGSAFVAGYALLFGLVIQKKHKQPISKALLLTTLFLLLHFLIFRRSQTNNAHLFYDGSITAYFYYILPDLLNVNLVLYFMLDDVLYDGWGKMRTGAYAKHFVRYGFLLLAMYMALFSNLFSSIILTAYIGCQLVREFVKCLQKKACPKECFCKNSFRLVYIALWGLEQIFEMNGRRANSLRSEEPFFTRLGNTLRQCSMIGRSFSRVFLLIGAAVVLIAGILFLKNRKQCSKSGAAGGRKLCVGLQMTVGGGSNWSV